MALPAIALLLAFLGGLFATPILFRPEVKEYAFIAAGLITTVGALMHWSRFHVPITVAAGSATLCAFAAACLFYVAPLRTQTCLIVHVLGGGGHAMLRSGLLQSISVISYNNSCNALRSRLNIMDTNLRTSTYFNSFNSTVSVTTYITGLYTIYSKVVFIYLHAVVIDRVTNISSISDYITKIRMLLSLPIFFVYSCLF